MKKLIVSVLAFVSLMGLSACYPTYTSVEGTLGTAMMALKNNDFALFQETMTQNFRAVAGNAQAFDHYKAVFAGNDLSIARKTVLQTQNHFYYDLPIYQVIEAELANSKTVFAKAILACTYKYSKMDVHYEIDPNDVSTYKVSTDCKIDGINL